MDKRAISPERKLASIEVQLLTTATGKFTFPNNNFLNGKTITAMWIPDNSEDDGFAPSGAALVPNECIRASQLTIQTGSDQKVQDVQLKYFMESDGDRRVRPLLVYDFAPGKTFVNIQDTTTFAAGESIVFIVEYLDV